MKVHLKDASFFRYIGQCGIGVIFMSIALFALESVAYRSSAIWAIGAGSLASSTYMVFVRPHQPQTATFQMLYSYLICTVIGVLGHVVLVYFDVSFYSYHFWWSDFVAALAVGIAIFMMARFRLQHSCAVGVSVMIVLDLYNYYLIGVIWLSVLCLTILHAFLKSKMRDLA
jgi:uncharacterized membrane protein YjjB (DUF3815 family)